MRYFLKCRFEATGATSDASHIAYFRSAGSIFPLDDPKNIPEDKKTTTGIAITTKASIVTDIEGSSTAPVGLTMPLEDPVTRLVSPITPLVGIYWYYFYKFILLLCQLLDTKGYFNLTALAMGPCAQEQWGLHQFKK